MKEKELVDALLESSSLRKDLLIQVGGGVNRYSK